MVRAMHKFNDLNKELDKESKIFHLDVFLDKDEMIHVRGRVLFVNNDYNYPNYYQKWKSSSKIDCSYWSRYDMERNSQF